MSGTVVRQPFKQLTPTTQPRNRQAQAPEDAGHAHVREETEADQRRRSRGEKFAEMAAFRAVDTQYHHQPNRQLQALRRIEGDSGFWEVRAHTREHSRGGPDAEARTLRSEYAAEPSAASVVYESPGKAHMGQAIAELVRKEGAETARASFAAREDLQGSATQGRASTGQSMTRGEEDMPHAAEFSDSAQAAVEEERKKRLLIQSMQAALETVAQAQLCLQYAHEEVRTALSEFTTLEVDLRQLGGPHGDDEGDV